MSLFNSNFIAADGSPMGGRVPTQLLVYAPSGYTLSDVDSYRVVQAYNAFSQGVNASAIPNGYHVKHYDFPDGSKARMESNGGVQRVMYWPVVEGNTSDVATFFCVPFDYSYRTDPSEKVFTIKRWPDVDKLENKNTFLDKLVEDKSRLMYAPDLVKKNQVHPGNQTWFANSHDPDNPHPMRHYVLSWWGQENRYFASPYSADEIRRFKWGKNLRTDGLTWDNGYFYGGVTVDPGTEYHVGAPGATLSPRIGGWLWALSNTGWWTRFPGQTLDVGGTMMGIPSTIEIATISQKLFINGYCVDLPSGLSVMSACIGKRVKDGVENYVVRIVPHFGEKPLYVYEVPLSRVLQAVMDSHPTLQSDEFTIYNIPAIAGYSDARWQVQPPYWNADGDKAVGHFIANRSSIFGSVLYELTLTTEGFSIALLSPSESSFDGTFTHDAMAYSYYTSGVTGWRILGADYHGNELRVLKMSFTLAVIDGALGASTLDLNETRLGNWEHSLSQVSSTTDTYYTGVTWAHCILGGDLRGSKVLLNKFPINRFKIEGYGTSMVRHYASVVELDLDSNSVTDVISNPPLPLSRSYFTSIIGLGETLPSGHQGGFRLDYSDGLKHRQWQTTDMEYGVCTADYVATATASALSPDGKMQYIGVALPMDYTPYDWDFYNAGSPFPHAAPITLDRWYVNGQLITPAKEYPKNGEGKMLSSPVFVGPLPPLMNQVKR